MKFNVAMGFIVMWLKKSQLLLLLLLLKEYALNTRNTSVYVPPVYQMKK